MKDLSNKELLDVYKLVKEYLQSLRDRKDAEETND
jgi:hypothetical protein